MKKRWRIRRELVFCFLVLGLILGAMGGCGKKGEKTVTGHVSLSRGKITENSVVLGVGNEGVRYSELQGYCYLLRKQYQSSFGGGLWDYSLDGKQTIGDEAKEEIINMITELKVIAAAAKQEKVELTADEKDDAIRQAEKVLSEASDKDKEKYHLTEQIMTGIFENNILANKMFYIATDAASTEVSDEEARQAAIQYLYIMTEKTDENGVKTSLSDQEKETARKRVGKLLTEAKKASDFLEFARKNSDDTRVELFLGHDEDSLPSEVVTTGMALGTGKFSDVVTASNGFYILYCVNSNDSDATYRKKEEIIESRQVKMFKEKYTRWLGESEISISSSFWKIFEI